MILSKLCRHKSSVCRHIDYFPESSKKKKKLVVSTQVQCVSTHPLLPESSKNKKELVVSTQGAETIPEEEEESGKKGICIQGSRASPPGSRRKREKREKKHLRPEGEQISAGLKKNEKKKEKKISLSL
ncbi:hypothetical protein Taro_035666 [Colocasia esculenta]|uniref:Uncharacterized protein n=1 Tax=Colocasia esculenta TaxID=4460 RepID=A0A843W4H5_COLES|nr:hypothetical protein [Colocasia esculenta]